MNDGLWYASYDYEKLSFTKSRREIVNNKVSVGITSIIGWLAALGGLLPTIIKALEEGQVALAGPEKYLAIAGISFGLLTNISRYLQANKNIVSTKVIENVENNVVTNHQNTPKEVFNYEPDEEIANDIDSVSTQVPSQTPDGDNSSIEPSPVSIPGPSDVPHAHLG